MKYKLEVIYNLDGDIEENINKIYESQYGSNFIPHKRIEVSCENGKSIIVEDEVKE